MNFLANAFTGHWGLMWAAFGAALVTFLSGTGSAIGVSKAGQAASGVVAEEPEKYASCLLLELLPGSQGIYGLIIAFFILSNSGILAGQGASIETWQGFAYFVASLPCAFGCFTSAVAQGKVAVSAIGIVAKRGDGFGNGMVLTLMVETYALFSFLISILLVLNVAK